MAPGAADENMFVPEDKSSTLGLFHFIMEYMYTAYSNFFYNIRFRYNVTVCTALIFLPHHCIV